MPCLRIVPHTDTGILVTGPHIWSVLSTTPVYSWQNQAGISRGLKLLVIESKATYVTMVLLVNTRVY